MRSIKVGFIGFGEVASILSKPLLENGAEVAVYDILLSQPDGLEILKKRVQTKGIRLLPLPEMVIDSQYIISTVTTQVAIKAAADCAAYLKKGQIYIDFNSTAPSVKVEIGQIIQRTGANFVEGAILGAVGAAGVQTHILTGGDKGKEIAELLTDFGLNLTFYSSEIGKASLFKMLRSIFSKGLKHFSWN